ncbi:MAG: nucleotidyltransferase family protein [Planctomycetota bacterium]|jgi:NDP-sugar pyrophosphorylase family protein
MKLFINVGGKGKRMGELTADIPKPMVMLNGKPILEHLLEWAVNNRFSETVLLCGYKHEVISNYFSDGSSFGIKISYSIEPEPLGSGGPIKFAEPFIDNSFAYINGDLFCMVDFKKMLASHNNSDAIMTILVHKSSHPEDSDVLQLDSSNKVQKFISKNDPHIDCGNLTNAGLCILSPEVLKYMDKKVFTFETYIYPALLKAGEYINGYVTEEFIKDIGTVERLKEVEYMLKEKVK